MRDKDELTAALVRGQERTAGIRTGSLMDRVKGAIAAGFEDGIIAASLGVSETTVRRVREQIDEAK